MQPYRLRCGPFSGYSVSATLEELSSGEWQIIVRLNPWLPELSDGERVFRRTFQDRVRAALELSDLLVERGQDRDLGAGGGSERCNHWLGCVECFACAEDKPEGVEIASNPALTPSGAFSAELWLRPKPEMAQAETTMLLDCNYYLGTRDEPRANKGYAFLLRREAGALRPTVILGLGSQTITHKGKPVTLEAETWYKIGFAYDGKGRVTIFLDGQEIGGGVTPDAGPVAPTMHPMI